MKVISDQNLNSPWASLNFKGEFGFWSQVRYTFNWGRRIHWKAMFVHIYHIHQNILKPHLFSKNCEAKLGMQLICLFGLPNSGCGLSASVAYMLVNMVFQIQINAWLTPKDILPRPVHNKPKKWWCSSRYNEDNTTGTQQLFVSIYYIILILSVTMVNVQKTREHVSSNYVSYPLPK